MKITFVGTFDISDISSMEVSARLIEIIPFEKGRIEELKTDTMKFKGYSAKITFNTDLKPIKIIFRKDKREKKTSECK